MIILAVCLFVPIGEELLYRGYNLSAWWRDLGARSAILRSGLFFAVVHVLNVNVDPTVQDAALAGIKQATIEFLVIAPVGLALGWLFVRRGLASTIAGHAAFNFLGVLGLLLTSGFVGSVFHGI
jgi:membrane protease YdiL (CAAX protease family)